MVWVNAAILSLSRRSSLAVSWAPPSSNISAACSTLVRRCRALTKL
jgi:hypothetical protein